MPSLRPGGQSASGMVVQTGSVSGVPMIMNSATVGGNGGVGAFVESDGVVLDIAVVDESEVSDASAFGRADVSAHPVVVELVVVGAGAEAGAAASRQSAGEQFIPERGVAR